MRINQRMHLILTAILLLPAAYAAALPSDQELFFKARFLAPLAPDEKLHASRQADDDALQAVLQGLASGSLKLPQAFKDYLDAHPDSRFASSLWLNYGLYSYR